MASNPSQNSARLKSLTDLIKGMPPVTTAPKYNDYMRSKAKRASKGRSSKINRGAI